MAMTEDDKVLFSGGYCYSLRLLDGTRLTPTNAIQAGEMRYHEGGSSPYHRHVGTSANPDGASHCYTGIAFRSGGSQGPECRILDQVEHGAGRHPCSL